MSFGTDTLSFMAGKLDGYTAEVYSALVGSWPGQTITTLYIIIAGYAILKGHAGEHAKELGISMVLLIVLQSLVHVGGGYNDWVASPVLSMTQGLGQVAIDATGVRGGDVFQSLDDGLGQIMHTVDTIQPMGNILTNAWMYLKVGTASLLMTLAFCVMYVVFLVLYLMAIFSIYMMLMVGGIFLWLASFRATRHLTWAWLRAVANYVIWVFFLSAVAGFFMSLITETVGDMANWDLAVDGAFPSTLGRLIFFSVLVTYLLLKTADWSAALTGGSTMSPGIVTSGYSSITNLGRGGKSGGKGGGGNAPGGNSGGGKAALARAGAGRAFSALKGLAK